MKKQVYSKPQMKVVLLKKSVSVLLGTSNITTIRSVDNSGTNLGIEWGDADSSGEAF